MFSPVQASQPAPARTQVRVTEEGPGNEVDSHFKLVLQINSTE